MEGTCIYEDTECIVAKAVRDGGIDAVIDHTNKWMLYKEVADIYATAEPAVAFHERVSFCLDMQPAHKEYKASARELSQSTAQAALYAYTLQVILSYT